jgi:predicted Zn-dependent peptidase
VCLKLLPAVVSAPTFPDKEMSEVRDQMITAVRQQRDDAQALAQVHFANELWGDANARGWPVTAATVQAITRDDLVAWHKTWFHPGNAVLAVAGDVDAKALQKQLEAAFRGWKPGKAPEHARHDEPAVQGIRVRLVDKPDQTQSQIVLGHLGIAHGDKDYYAVQIMNYGLGGGGFSSRLMKVVRSEGGKTYGARSGFDTYATRGAFAASTFTRSEETRSTIDLVLGEIAAMKAGGPSAEEISDAKANLAGRWVTGFESASDVAGTVLAAELHGFGDDYVREFALRAGAVTADEARRAAAARLDANNLVIVIVGAAKDVEPQLKQAGWPYEVISADAPIAKIDRAPAVAAPVTDAERKQALAIIDAALKAKGGEKKLAAVKSMVMEGTAEISFGPRSFPATLKRWWVLPDSLRYELTLQIPGLGDVPIVTVLDGTSGWGRRPDDQTGTIELSDMGPEEVTEARKQMWRDGDFILLRAKDEGTQLRPLASETIDGVEYDVVEVAAKGSSVKLYIDAKSRLLGRMAYLDGGEEALELFSSYKSVDGISVAHKRKTTASMGKLESTVTSVSFDEAVKDAVFAKPDK